MQKSRRYDKSRTYDANFTTKKKLLCEIQNLKNESCFWQKEQCIECVN